MTAPKPAPLTAEEEREWRSSDANMIAAGPPQNGETDWHFALARVRVWATLDAERAKVAYLLAAAKASLALCKQVPQGHSEERVEAERLARAAIARAKGDAS